MISLNWWMRAMPLPLILAALSPLSPAQSKNVLSVASIDKLAIRRGATGEVKIKLQLDPAYHVNSNTPSESYLIPLKITWAKEPLIAEEVSYPKPQMEKYAFSPTPLSVFSGTFEIVTRFKAPADARNGPVMMPGKLRYQACNNRECLPPRTIDVAVPTDIQ